MSSVSIFLVFLVVFASIKTSDGKNPTICDPLVPNFCSLPFPNDYWLLKDGNNQPLHLNFSAKNFPISTDGVATDPYSWNLLDGFNPLPPILTFWKDLSIDNCAPLWNISQSTEENPPIVLLEADTMRRIPYWVELDHSSDDATTHEQQNRSLMIWPAERLLDGMRYIVAIRALRTNAGDPVLPSAAFAALRDNVTTNDPAVEERRPWFNTHVFAYLAANAVPRESLQLAWDFHVMSTVTQTQQMIEMRDDAFSRLLQKGGLRYEIVDVVDDYSNWTMRQIQGFVSVPWYLNKRGPGVDTRIVTAWDNVNQPVYQRDEEVNFEILIPRSVANFSKPGHLLQFGHGLFASYNEMNFVETQTVWNEWGYVVGGVNWLGMCFEDVPFVTRMLSTNLTDFPMLPDRLHQGMLNALVFMKLLLDEDFQKEDAFSFGGRSVFGDNTGAAVPHNYWGISLGGIMGSVYMSLTTDVINGVCNVPGFPFALLLPRSTDFGTFAAILHSRYPEDVDFVLIMNLAQLLWTRLSPSGYISHLNDPDNLFPGTPLHNVLIQYGLGDHQVSFLGAELLGRSLHAYAYTSNVPEYNETLFGFQWIDDDVTIDVGLNPGSVLIQDWNFNQPQVPFVNLPPHQGSDTHDWTSQQYDAQQIAFSLYNKNLIYNACGHSCQGHAPFNANENEKISDF